MYSLSSVRQTAKVALQPFLESSRICACTVERFKRYLETDLLPHLNGNSVLAMDNMKSHHAKAVKELLDSSGVRYIYPLSFRTLSALVRVGTEKHKGKIYCFPFSFPASKRGI